MTKHPFQETVQSLTDAERDLPAEAVSARVGELRAEQGFPMHQTHFILLEAEEELLALQHRNHCSIGVAIHE